MVNSKEESVLVSSTRSKKFLKGAGFNLIEVMLALAVFSLAVLALAGAFLYGLESAQVAGKRARAILVAEEGLEAVRNIRDADFANLIDGTHGLAVSSNQWILSGSQDVVDIFTRQIIISSVDSDRKQVVSQVDWDQSLQRAGSVAAATYLTNWQETTVITGTCAEECISLGYNTGTCRQNPAQCTNNGETFESSGNLYCTVDPGANTCCCSGTAPADTTAPAAITDLAASDPTTNSVNLSWTSPGDDGSSGTATAYDARYLTVTITESNWASATQVVGEPSPSIAGSSESMTVLGLSSDTAYYFAIKTSDEIPNTSIISNVPSATTQSAMATCDQYCQGQGYSTGTCRANAQQCTKNSETYEPGGDTYCTGGGSSACCCAP